MLSKISADFTFVMKPALPPLFFAFFCFASFAAVSRKYRALSEIVKASASKILKSFFDPFLALFGQSLHRSFSVEVAVERQPQ